MTSTSFAKPKRASRWTPLGVAAFVLGFMVWWPLGLAIIAYILWGGSVDDLAADIGRQFKEMFRSAAPRARSYGGSSGNAAFDAYREETLKRLEEERRKLEEERREFEAFMDELRQARDREEFERFMNERKKKNARNTGPKGSTKKKG